MGKLMKYELRKQLMSKIILLGVMALLEAILLIGLFLEKQQWVGTAIGLFFVTVFVSMFYFSFESIITFSNDLKTKQSYMLFLTPRNMYQIVGAKILVTIIQIVGVGLIFMVIGIGNMFLVASRFGELQELLDIIKELIQMLADVEIRLVEVVYVILMMLVAWLVFITMAMFAITLSSTLFANKKYKGVLSVVIYFVLDWLVTKVAALVIPTGFLKSGYLVVNTEAWAFIGVYTVVLVLDFVGTALLLEKKVNV
ncbi:MAG: hypothetical protein J1E35_07450 [Lachnospiraceae bacterium]|nr:hypothetical protein [Lachnospiraceae bacterium]